MIEMPPRPKYTKDEIIDAAVDIIRTDGIYAITAQEIAKRLGTSTRPMFTYFSTVEELRNAAHRDFIRELKAKARKADAVVGAVQGPVTNTLPSSIMQMHPDCGMFLDPASAAKLV